MHVRLRYNHLRMRDFQHGYRSDHNDALGLQGQTSSSHRSRLPKLKEGDIFSVSSVVQDQPLSSKLSTGVVRILDASSPTTYETTSRVMVLHDQEGVEALGFLGLSGSILVNFILAFVLFNLEVFHSYIAMLCVGRLGSSNHVILVSINSEFAQPSTDRVTCFTAYRDKILIYSGYFGIIFIYYKVLC